MSTPAPAPRWAGGPPTTSAGCSTGSRPARTRGARWPRRSGPRAITPSPPGRTRSAEPAAAAFEALAALQDQSFARRGSAEVVADVLNTQVPDVLTIQRAAPAVIIGCRRPRVFLGLVLVRYRYRLCPSTGQRQSLARVFGCARVVYNDCLRLREECHAAGVKIGDAGVQRRVVTLAKLTPERQWLATAPSVALVQACNDARRACRNYFDSRSGKRKGRKIGHPRFRSKRGRQSIRLTRNGFSLRGPRLYVAKVGQIKLRWSRRLPSPPSSVTVIREPDGRYYASFVVERAPAPLPDCDHEVGVDVGLARLAVTSGGEIIANPRFLRARQRRLAKAQRALSRKQKGRRTGPRPGTGWRCCTARCGRPGSITRTRQ